jgi:hypothetical protein
MLRVIRPPDPPDDGAAIAEGAPTIGKGAVRSESPPPLLTRVGLLATTRAPAGTSRRPYALDTSECT